MLSTGADSAEALVLQVMLCGADFDLIEPADLRPSLIKIAGRLRRAVRLAGRGRHRLAWED